MRTFVDGCSALRLRHTAPARYQPVQEGDAGSPQARDDGRGREPCPDEAGQDGGGDTRAASADPQAQPATPEV